MVAVSWYVPCELNACDVTVPPSKYVPAVEAEKNPAPATVEPDATFCAAGVAVSAPPEAAAQFEATRAYAGEPPVSSVPNVEPEGAVEQSAVHGA